MTTPQHSWQRQICRTASQHQHQEHQHWRQQQQTTNKHSQQKSTLNTDEQSGNSNGWHTHDPKSATQQKNWQEHCSSQQQPINKSWSTFPGASKEQSTSRSSDQRRSLQQKQSLTSTFSKTAIGQDFQQQGDPQQDLSSRFLELQ